MEGTRMPATTECLVPEYPSFLRQAAKMARNAIGGKVVRQVNDEFLSPLTKTWVPSFAALLETFTRLEKKTDPKFATVASRSRLSKTSYSRMKNHGQFSLGAFLATLRNLRMPWEGKPDDESVENGIATQMRCNAIENCQLLHQKQKAVCLPPIRSVADTGFNAECYVAAITYAQCKYEIAKLGINRQRSNLSRNDFEYLLWLFREPEWFSPELKLTERQRGVIADRICSSARQRLGINGNAQNSGAGTDSETQVDRISMLQRLQQAFTYGWVIAIDVVGRYKWEV